MGTSLKQRLISGGLWVLLGKGLAIASGLIVNASLTRILSVEAYATYLLGFSLVLIGMTAGHLGMQQAVVRLVAEAIGKGSPGRARGAAASSFRLGGLGVLFMALLAWLGPGAFVARNLLDSEPLAANMGLVALWMTALGLLVLTGETFRGLQDMRLASMFTGVATGILTAVTFGGIWLFRGEATLEIALKVSIVATVIALVAARVMISRSLAALGPREEVRSSEILSVAVPMWVTTLTMYALQQSDLLILAAMNSKQEVALYGAAFRMVMLVIMPLFLVNMIVPPVIAEMYPTGQTRRLERLLRTAATWAGFPALGILLVFVLAGPMLMGLIYGETYRDGATVLAILSVGKLVAVAAGSCGMTLNMTGHHRALMMITIICSVLTVTTAILVARPFGGVGVATAVSAGESLQNLLMWLAARYHTGMWTHVGIPRVQDVKTLFARSA